MVDINFSDGAKQGLWIYKLDTMNDFINYAVKCYEWIQNYGGPWFPIATWANSILTKCPCIEERIKKDGRFVPYPKNSNCYVQKFSPAGFTGTRVISLKVFKNYFYDIFIHLLMYFL